MDTLDDAGAAARPARDRDRLMGSFRAIGGEELAVQKITGASARP